MQLGIMTRMFSRPTLEQVADAVRAAGFAAVQLNMVSAGLPALPEQLDEATARHIGSVFRDRGIAIAAVSANFNAIHPDPARRAAGIRRVAALAARCAALGTAVLTMCTGTRDPDDMWRHHPENGSPEAWRDLLATTRELLGSLRPHGVTLAFEPEVVNVVDSAAAAQRFVEEIASPALRVLLDPANLVRPADLPDTRPVLRDAFRRLGPYVAMAHAKDVVPPDPGASECRRVAAGDGLLDYDCYLEELVAARFSGALVLHDLTETQIGRCRGMLGGKLATRTH